MGSIITDHLDAVAAAHPDRVAAVTPRETITYGELARRSVRVALGLLELGVRPGDVVWFPPGERHWHGATASTAMSHIAIQEKLNGSPVDWLEHVTDAQYRAGLAA